MAYSLDLRRRALTLLSQDYKIEEVSNLLNIGTATLWRWKAREKQGNLEASYPKTRDFYKIDEAKLRQFISDNPDAYQHEIAEALGVTRTGVQYALARLGITRKKRHHNTKSETMSYVPNLRKK